MSTTIRIRVDDKKRLDQLQAQLLLRGKRVTQEELLNQLIQMAELNPALLEAMVFRPLDDEQIQRIAERSYQMGTAGPETYDDSIYGDG